LWKRANEYFLFTITRVAREIWQIIAILKTAENVSSLDASYVPVNVSTSPFDYVDINPDVTETSIIASMNVLKPFETASNLHVEPNVETCVEPNVDVILLKHM